LELNRGDEKSFRIVVHSMLICLSADSAVSPAETWIWNIRIGTWFLSAGELLPYPKAFRQGAGNCGRRSGADDLVAMSKSISIVCFGPQ